MFGIRISATVDIVMACVERYRAAGRGGPDRIGSIKYHVIHNNYYIHRYTRVILYYYIRF